ncbi:MAG: hypothetical protein ACJ8LG_08990 [Massilia sp.]
MASPDEVSPWLQVAGTVVGALIGGAGTLLGGWFAQRTESKAQRTQQADAYQLRIWMELQDALEGIDNALAEVLGTVRRGSASSEQAAIVDFGHQYRTVTLRTRILRARLVDAELIRLAAQACELADQCVAQLERSKIQDSRAKFLKSVELINQRINELIVESRVVG